ncbi:aminoglycoside phosphotransferase (APT) family kinase protein [Nocardia kruczakiae]|uniref:Aminoglycoside phosphotransferase (APT) family kinase protein n=1 Tax=Nocardia kruczakiae TaxID=261477 RepID=A0ABU1XJM9_9NOCA|nr:phosphotransferase family protein [Nocardia kruczakiae]MDR7170758.1 aminoglycoside phosphotransferase (APT) family kinase protein [Nocardia kruczakiae]
MAVSAESAAAESVTLTDGVRAVLADTLGTSITDVALRQFTGGASRQVYAVEARDGTGAAVRAVLRRDPPGHGDSARMHAEAVCLRAAGAAGVPVPAVLADGATAPGIDAPYLLMERVDGESIPRKLQRDPAFAAVRDRLAGDLGYVLGLIHRTPLDTLDILDDHDPLATIDQIYRDLDDPRPAVEAGLCWLREHRPAERPKALVHGDFRLGNFLIEPDGVRAVLDWELAHLGNPIEDLGWLCVRAWRFGAEAPVGGLGSRQQLLDGYERSAGYRPTAAELHWWEVFGTLKWLVLSRFQAHRHLSGDERSLELAAIGRRVCESEYDLLTVLDLLDDTVPTPAPSETPATVHDRPHPAEILELVAETLTAEIGPALPAEQARARYLLRVCANLLGIAARESAAGPAATDAVHGHLAASGCESEADLAAHLRSGAVSYTDQAVRRAISAAVLARLRIANPRHLR